LTSKPRVCPWRFHRIYPLGHSLVDVIASGALKRPDIEALGAGCDSRQHRCCLAQWTWRSGMGEHDCTPSSCGESTTELSVTGSCRVGAVMEPASAFRDSAAVLFCSHFKLIDASLGNYDTPGFKLEQLLESCRGHGQRSDTISFQPGRTGRNRCIVRDRPKGHSPSAARRTRNKDATIITPCSDNIIRTHKHRSTNTRELPFGATIDDAQH
jgi:hypothetical protein